MGAFFFLSDLTIYGNFDNCCLPLHSHDRAPPSLDCTTPATVYHLQHTPPLSRMQSDICVIFPIQFPIQPYDFSDTLTPFSPSPRLQTATNISSITLG